MKSFIRTSIAVLFLIPPFAVAMTLEQYLMEVMKKNKDFQSYEISKEAAADRRTSGDILLSPVLTMDAGLLSDAKVPQSTGGTKLVSSQYALGASKQFSSGTSLGLNGSLQKIQISNPTLPTIPSDYSTGTLGVQISQSLWKNAFGHGIHLRQEREGLVASLEREDLSLKQRQVLFNAECAYWDYLYQQEEVTQKTESLDRAKKIEAWLKRRYQDGINDRADFLNAQALTTSRELQLTMSRDQLAASARKLKDTLEMGDDEKLPTFSSDFKQARSLNKLIQGSDSSGQIVRMDAYLASLNAKMRSLASQEAKDALLPDLTLQGSYATNSYSAVSSSEALANVTRPDTPTTQVGVKFSYIFDTDSKVSKLAVARKEAVAAQLQSERKMLESESSWSELQRRYGELLKQIDSAERLNKIQLARAKELTLKLSRGRAVTSDVVTSEEDASTSSLSLSRMLAEARKFEAQSRLFIRLTPEN